MIECTDYTELMRQACWTVKDYARSALEFVREQGVPKDQQGVIVAAMIQAAAKDFHSSALAIAIQELTGAVENTFGNLGSDVRGGLDNISDSIDRKG